MSSDPRPAKRQRRSTVVLSDDDEQAGPTTALPLRRPDHLSEESARRPNSIRKGSTKHGLSKDSKPLSPRNASARPSPKSSPQKARKTQKLGTEDIKSQSLHNFFSKVSEEERWRKRSATPEVEHAKDEIEDDIIDDDSIEDALAEAIRRSEEDLVRHRPTSTPSQSVPISTQSSAAPPSSGKFLKPALPHIRAASQQEQQPAKEDRDRPWTDRYGPISLDELAIHKKKLQDVERCLEDMLTGRVRQRLLVLKGPAGSGKSTTIKLLSRARRFDIVAWQNPDRTESGTSSGSVQFAEFITRGGDYSALSLESEDYIAQRSCGWRRVLLLEDFPASLTRSSNAIDSFRSVLLQAAASMRSLGPFSGQQDPAVSPPIVLIVSETLVSSSTAFADSFTAQRLLGPELLNHPAMCIIEFNRVAPTFLSKALDLVIKKEARDSARRRIPGPAVLQKLAEIGDVRNAINTLQFLCTRSDDKSDWSGTVASNAKHGSRLNVPLSTMEAESLKLITTRETTLDMFHAAGKVCYNKREDPRIADKAAPPSPKLPAHLSHLHRSKVSQVDIEALLNETGTDIQTFVSTVHQNYVLSCNHDDFVDYFDGCAAVLSDAELLDPDSRSFSHSRARAQASRGAFQLGTSDSLRQNEISFQVATRGVLYNLPFPVSRATPPGAGRAAAFKMYYPAALRLWRPIEEMEGLLELVIAQLSGQQSTKRGRDPEAGGVLTWKVRAGMFGVDPGLAEDSLAEEPPRTDLSKDSLLLDILPYLTRIKSSRGEDVKVMKKITQLRGFDAALEEEPEEQPRAEPLSGSAKLTRRIEAVHRTLEAQKAHQAAKKKIIEAPPVEKLYIEDDDIEDDD